jgi:hypothetical protein
MIVDYILGTSVMQQLILLLTSFLLACGFPAFLIGFYSIRIWESRLRSLSISSVSSIRLDTTPPPGFQQPRLITCQESTSGFSPAGVTESAAISGLPPAGGTGYEAVTALRVHFQLLLYSLQRVRKPEVTPRFHLRFADPMPDMKSLLLPLREVPQFNRLLTRATLISGER